MTIHSVAITPHCRTNATLLAEHHPDFGLEVRLMWALNYSPTWPNFRFRAATYNLGRMLAIGWKAFGVVIILAIGFRYARLDA